MRITALDCQVEHIKPQSEAQAYAGAESLTYVRCRVTTDDGLTGDGGFESANLPVMAGHAHGGMLEVHGAHAAIKARFATHPEFREGKLHVPDAPGPGFSLKD